MARTALQIIQNAAPKIGVDTPSLLFGSADETAIELRTVLQEAAERITRAHDWSILKTEATYAGDGTTEGFALPSDYLRMPKDGQVWSSRWQRPMLPVTSEEWLRLDVRNYDLIAGTWVLLGGEMKFRPVLATGESARWFYVADVAVAPATGSNKARFTDDADTYRLGDRLLELQFIWEWRQRKGLPYAEDMASAEIALAQAIGEDKGARMIVQSSRRRAQGHIAYPWNVG